jgi:hypothetical protein
MVNTHDVYFGALPRDTRSGGANAVRQTWALWVDADSRQATTAIAAHDPWPSIVVRTSEVGLHCYWLLEEALSARYVPRANRRLAHHLQCDMRATDPARILRLPGTLNHKTDPPRPVRVERFAAQERFNVRDLVGDLADPPTTAATTAVREIKPGADVIFDLASATYIPMLLGVELRRDGKIGCPFHDDSTPSLQTYTDPARGWVCFGCGMGGTAIDFGAHLYGITPRGRGYWEIRRRLAGQLLGQVAA